MSRLVRGSQPDAPFRIASKAVCQRHLRGHERNYPVVLNVQPENVFVLPQHPDVATGVLPDLTDDIDAQSVFARIMCKDFIAGIQMEKTVIGGSPQSFRIRDEIVEPVMCPLDAMCLKGSALFIEFETSSVRGCKDGSGFFVFNQTVYFIMGNPVIGAAHGEMPHGSVRCLENDAMGASQPETVIAVPQCGDIPGVLYLRQVGNRENDGVLMQGQHSVVGSEPDVPAAVWETVPGDGRMNLADAAGLRIDLKNAAVRPCQQLTIFILAQCLDDRHRDSGACLLCRKIVLEQCGGCSKP